MFQTTKQFIVLPMNQSNESPWWSGLRELRSLDLLQPVTNLGIAHEQAQVHFLTKSTLENECSHGDVHSLRMP